MVVIVVVVMVVIIVVVMVVVVVAGTSYIQWKKYTENGVKIGVMIQIIQWSKPEYVGALSERRR